MIRKVHKFGLEVYELTKEELKIYVLLEEGMTITQVEYGTHVVIPYNEERHKKGMTHGIPILYPTPNRSREDKFTFMGDTYDASAHGFLRNQRFDLVSKEEEDVVSMEGSFVLDRTKDVYVNYPYESIIHLKYILETNRLTIQYAIENKGDSVMPYGLGLHPFFENIDGDAKVLVRATEYMKMGLDKLPSGELISVKEQGMDLRDYRFVSELSLDHVYTNLSSNPNAIIQYKDTKIVLDSSEEFGHMVVFTPEKPFFCIENQTCSTDAINLYGLGYKKESGLQMIPPHGSKQGYVTFTWEGR